MARRSGVTAVDLPLAGLRVGVLHLQFLLPGASLLRGHRAERKRGGNSGGEPTGDTGKAWKPGWITATANGPTGNAADAGA